MSTSDLVSNKNIPFDEIVLITDEGHNLGRKSLRESLNIAEAKNLDLVLVNSNEKNPVCKIMDLGKMLYEEKQKRRKAKSANKKQKTKEIRFSVNTELHDLEIKARQTNKFLGNGSKVKINIKFPSRQQSIAMNMVSAVIDNFKAFLSEKFEESCSSYNNGNYVTELKPIGK